MNGGTIKYNGVSRETVALVEDSLSLKILHIQDLVMNLRASIS